MTRKPLSLRAQAVVWLAQREHSELELRRKLWRRLRAQGDAGKRTDVASLEAAPGAAEQVDQTIVWLCEQGYLDEARFVASRVHLRSSRLGLVRIQHELSQHGLTMPEDAARRLRSTEFERALDICQRKFRHAAVDGRTAARQARFLAARGFSGDVVRQVLRAVNRGQDGQPGV